MSNLFDMTPREFAEGLADAIMNMLYTSAYIKADGTVIGHRGHGGMWNAWECDRDAYIDSDTSAEFTRSTWIFPGENEYCCPYLNRYARGMYEWICDDDGEEMEDFDDVAARFQVSVVTSADTCTLYLGIDNQLDRNVLVYSKVIDLKSTAYLSDELIDAIVEEVDAAVTNFNG